MTVTQLHPTGPDADRTVESGPPVDQSVVDPDPEPGGPSGEEAHPLPLVLADPATLLLAGNVRGDARLDKPFVASVRDHGVLVPIVAHRTADGDLSVLYGARRTLAAVEAGRREVPVYVVEVPEEEKAREVYRLVRQLTENDHRDPLREAERVTAYQQLSLLGSDGDGDRAAGAPAGRRCADRAGGGRLRGGRGGAGPFRSDVGARGGVDRVRRRCRGGGGVDRRGAYRPGPVRARRAAVAGPAGHRRRPGGGHRGAGSGGGAGGGPAAVRGADIGPAGAPAGGRRRRRADRRGARGLSGACRVPAGPGRVGGVAGRDRGVRVHGLAPARARRAARRADHRPDRRRADDGGGEGGAPGGHREQQGVGRGPAGAAAVAGRVPGSAGRAEGRSGVDRGDAGVMRA